MADLQRKTANLFDVNNVVDGGDFYISVATGGVSAKMSPSNNTDILLIPCQPNTTYTVSRQVLTKRFGIGFLPSAEIYADMPVPSFAYNDSATELTATSVNDSQYLCIYYAKHAGSDSDTAEVIQACLDTLMVNEGSTALPYEPYGWVHSLRKLTTAADDIAAFPATIYGVGEASTGWELEGNTVQNGTPSSSSPVAVNGVGKKTENLFDKNGTVYQAYLTDTQWLPNTDSSSVKIPCQPNTEYTISVTTPLPIFRIATSSSANIQPDNAVDVVARLANVTEYTFTTNSTAHVMIFQGSNSLVSTWLNELMVNTGSTAKPYEPYGYKLSFTDGQLATNVYLGSTSSTRQVKKLVLTGDEDWHASSVTAGSFWLPYSAFPGMVRNTEVYCSHLTYTTAAGYQYGKIAPTNSDVNFFLFDTAKTLDECKTWIAQQLSVGNPLTVYYILSTATTGTVNEPLMKIGNYADSITQTQAGTAIQLSDGKSTLDIDSDVKPSKLTLTYKGWHDASLKEYDGSDWV